MISALIVVGIFGVCALFLIAGRRPGPPGLPEAAAEGAVPAPPSPLVATSPGGWPRGTVEVFDADTLFEKINGKAGAYFAYGFQRLHFASYADPQRPDASWIDVYLYELASPLDAFGIYRAQRSGREEGLDAGAEAVTTPMAVFGRQGPFYVEAMVADPGARAEAEALVRTLLDAVSSDGQTVALPTAFPAEGLGRVTFDRENAANVEALRNAFTATYQGGGRILISRADTPADAATAAQEAQEILEFLGERALVAVEGTSIVVVLGFGEDAPSRLATVREAIRKEAP